MKKKTTYWSKISIGNLPIKKHVIIMMLAVLFPLVSFSQTVYTFTNAGATGRFGPTQSQVTTAYTATTLAGAVTVNTQGIQEWIVPVTGNYRIRVAGASGQNSSNGVGGQGMIAESDYTLTAGTVLNIVVGQQGLPTVLAGSYNGGAGGGGSFVYTGAIGGGGLLSAAGGGGGALAATSNVVSNTNNANFGPNGYNITDAGGYLSLGGTAGNGGGFSNRNIYSGGPGAGWLSDYNPAFGGGSATIGGTRFVGGTATSNGKHGGFGGGGASGDNNNSIYAWAGGGGGYSGGAGGHNGGAGDGQVGGGGGSFLSGTSQTNVGFSTGNGSVVITNLYSASISQTAAVVCNSDLTGALSVAVIGGVSPYTYTWSPSISTTSTASNLGKGTYSVIVTDANTLSTTASFTIVPSDNTAPVITTNGDKNVNVTPGLCEATVTVSATATDNCSVGTPTGVRSDAKLLSDAYPVGTTTITWNVTDTNGNPATAVVQQVIVNDNIRPTAISKNITVQLNASGSVTVNAADLNNASTDNCGINNYKLASGSVGTACNVVGEGAFLSLMAPNASVFKNIVYASYGNSTGTCGNFVNGSCNASNSLSIVSAALLNNNSGSIYSHNNTFGDPCNGTQKRLTVQANYGPATTETASITYSCADLGTHNVVLFVTDNNGNVSSVNATITVEDKIAPTITCAAPALSYNNDLGNCSYTVTDTSLDPTFADNCTGSSVSNDFNNSATLNGAVFPVGTTAVVWTVTDAALNTTTCTYNVVVVDAEAPTIACAAPAISYNNDLGNCSYTITDTSLDPTAFADNCTGSSVSNDFNNSSTLNGAIFPIGTTAVIWTVTDAALNTTTCTYNVVVVDAEAPTIACATPALSYNNDLGNCTYTVTDTSLDPTAFADNCTGSSVSNDFNNSATLNGAVFPIGTTTVVWTVTDAALNTTTCTYNVVVVDAEAPTITCAAPSLSYNNDIGNCTYTVTDTSLDPTAFADNCTGSSVSNNFNNSATLNGAIFPIGTTAVVWTVTDAALNTTTCTYNVVVVDAEAAKVLTKNITVQLDALGTATIVAGDVDNGSSDICGTVTLGVFPNTFTCANVGQNTVTLTATDANGNVSSQTAIVTIEDKIAPIVVTKDITVQLDAIGNASITPADVDNGTTDVCGTTTLVVAPNTFTCANVGNNTVTLTATDANGNVSSQTAIVTIEDKIAAVVATKNITVQLDATGNASITSADVDNGTTDVCGTTTLVVAPNTFTCANVGNNTVTLTATDANGNVSSQTAIVTIEDKTAAVVATKNITVQLDATGNASIVAADVNNGTTDACGTFTLSVSPNSFTCANVGNNIVTLTATDASGNVSSQTATITIEDKITPVVATKNITVQLDATGNSSIVAADVNNGTTDACGTFTLSVSPNSFTCANVGNNIVTLTATDASGNVSSQTATITIEDKITPVVATKSITVQLDATGNASIVAADVDNGTTDACGTPALVVAPNTFTCVNVGLNTVTLTATDANGNVSSQTATVTIENKNLPVVATKNITVQLDTTGKASITAAAVNNGSTVACGTPNLVVSPTTFTCANVGANTVTLTVTDANGNTSSKTATVTIQDKIAAVVVTKNLTVQLDASGNAAITAAQIDNGSSDSCGIASITVSPNTFSCNNVGANTVTLTITDINGNKSTGTAVVTVQDNILPTVKTQDLTVNLDDAGNASITASQINNGSSDNCGIATVSLDKLSFSCTNVGINTVVLTVRDKNGNTATATAKVTVVNTFGDNDNDGILDNCDNDDDNDGISDASDNCPTTANPFQEDRNANGLGDACDSEQMNISQAFTPNGDGINDTWVISNIELHTNSVVRVFNRWGTEVFVARNYQNDWDGHYKGDSKSLPESSSYYYQIDLDGNGSIDKEGWIYINK